MRPALSWTLPSTWENWENWGSTSQPTILPGKNGTKMYKTLYKLEKTMNVNQTLCELSGPWLP
jgi:hypothetical protein